MKDLVFNQVKLIEAIYKYKNGSNLHISYELDKEWEKDMEPTIFYGKIKVSVSFSSHVTIFFNKSGRITILEQGTSKEMTKHFVDYIIGYENQTALSKDEVFVLLLKQGTIKEVSEGKYVIA